MDEDSVGVNAVKRIKSVLSEAAALTWGAVLAVLRSVLEALFGQRYLRLELRARVLPMVARVEKDRWAWETREAFNDSVFELRSAVLAAGLPKRPADLYTELASQARMLSERDLGEFGWGEGEDPGGIIPPELSDLVGAAADSLIAYAWHPYRARLSLGRGLWRLERAGEAIGEGLSRDPREVADWDPLWFRRQRCGDSAPG